MPLCAVFFDAVGTLLHPEPGVVEAYLTVGTEHGSRKSAAEIQTRFRHAFRLQERLDAEAMHRTDEQRERRRWIDVVSFVFDDLADPTPCFEELWRHFGRPAAWRCDSAAGDVLRSLDSRGLTLGIASNFDARLHDVVRGFASLASLSRFVISSLVGWKKPAAAFYDAVCQAATAAPGDILFVGDDVQNDYSGPLAAGFQAVLLDPMRETRGMRSIGSLDELCRLIT